MAEILVSNKKKKDPVEISTLNNTEENVIELKFDDELFSSTTRDFLWEKKDALSPINIKKALAYAEIGMGLGVNMMGIQFH